MKVLVADKLSDAGVAALADEFDVELRPGLSKDALVAAIGEFDAVVVRSATTIDADVIAAADRLKVIARAGIGLDNVDVRAATAKGVLVCNAPQSNVISAAEHTVALLLALARRIPPAHASLVAGEWRRSDFQGVELNGKTLGVLGLGRVGTLVAQRCLAFGMRLVAYDPYVSSERAARLGVEISPTVAELCAAADVLTVHLPKSAETIGIVGEAELRALGPQGRVVNTARGGIIDEEALYRACAEGWIAGAALDVFSSEPMTESKLFGLENVIVTPHLGASTAEAQDKAGTMVAEAVKLALHGEFVPSAVNVQVGAGIDESVKPFMRLAETLGRLFTTLYGGVAGHLTVEYVGQIAAEDTQAVTLSALKGLLTDVVHEPVTFVNAPLLAQERGLGVVTLTNPEAHDYVSLVRLCSEELRVAGTLSGAKHRERLVEVWGLGIDMEPSEHMLFLRYSDRPGVVGTIGGRLGEAGINIASMQVGRTRPGGQAVIAMSVDSPIPADVAAELADSIGASDVRTITLGA